MIIDFHTHCFPGKIAEKAMVTLIQNAGAATAYHDGPEQSLSKKIRDMGADIAVVLNISTNPKQQKSVNDYAIEINGLGGLVAFGSVFPDSPQALYELERLHDAGVKGIKFHPDYQNFFVDDPRVFPLYKKASSLGLITVFHSGVDIGLPEPVHCSPKALAKVMPVFEGGTVVAAHFGGYMRWKEAAEYLAGTGAYIDTSYSHSHLPPPWAKEVLEAFGAKKTLLGSDMPWNATDNEILYIKSLGLSPADEEAVLGGNAAELLGLVV